MRNFWASEFPIGYPLGYGKYHDPMTAMAVGGAAASAGGGMFGKSSAKKAAKIQSGAAQKAADVLGPATNAANTVLGDAYREQTGVLSPWLNAGGNALNELAWGFGQDSTLYDPSLDLGPRKSAEDYRTELVDKFTIKGPRNK